MNTETAMILSAAIGVGASLITLLITRLFDTRSEKRKERERFFYEIYGRRLTLYRKILKQGFLFSDVTSSEPFDRPKKFGKIVASFIELSDMSTLVASPAVIDSLNAISNFIRDSFLTQKLGTREGLNGMISFMTEHLALVRDRIREETCPAIVDKYLFEITDTRFRHKTS